MKVVLASACLVGFNCKYNGGNNRVEEVFEAFCKGRVIPVCPEQLGGLPTPRQPAKIESGDGFAVLKGSSKVLTVKGKRVDVTKQFLRGAYETLFAARALKNSIVACIMKEKSPSCGVDWVYKFDEDSLKRGSGVASALLKREGFRVISSEDVETIKVILRELE